MNKLANLLKMAELFYQRTLYSLGQVQNAQTTYVSPDDDEDENLPAGGSSFGNLEALWDQIDNPELAKQIEKLMGAYENFSKSLKISLDDFSKDPDEMAHDAEENASDFLNALNMAWEKLIGNPYLSLDVDDPKYTESVSPTQILDAAESLVRDAKGQLDSTDITPEELASVQQAAQEYNELQHDKGDTKLTVTGDKIKQMLAANKKYRERLKLIKKIGPENLARRRAELEKQISETTNTIEQEELIKQLKRTPDPEQYHKFIANVKRRFTATMEDPTKKRVYLDKAITRQRQRRVNDRKISQHLNEEKMAELITKLNSPIPNSEKLRLTRDIVEIQKGIMEQKGIDFDDPFIANNPEVIAQLNPINIIKKYQDRFLRIKNERENEVKKSQELREKGRAGGDIDGLTEIFREQLATVVNELKKKINKKLDKEGFNDPFFKPYLDAVAKATDEQSRQAALTAQAAAGKEFKNNSPIVKALVNQLGPLELVKKKLMELTSQSRKGAKAKNNPWLYGEIIPEDKKQILGSIVMELEPHAGKFGQVSGADLDSTIRNIVAALKSKLG